MKNLLKPVAVFSGIMISAVSGVGAAQAGNIVPADGNGSFSPVIVSPGSTAAGVAFKLRNDAFGGPTGGTGDTANVNSTTNGLTAGANAIYAGSCGTAALCGYFDFFPTSNINGFQNGPINNPGSNILPVSIAKNSGVGVVQIVNSAPDNPSFAGVLGQFGVIKDFKLPYFGPQDNLSTGIPPITITKLLDFGRVNAADNALANTFDATALTNITFRATSNGTGTEASFQFAGLWNVLNPDNTTTAYAGTVTLAQSITVPINTVISRAETNAGFRSGYAGQTDVVPEPLTMLGAGAALGFGSFFKRKISKTKKGNKAA